MIPRSDNQVSHSIQREKSAASVKERRKHPLPAKSVDPQTARTHALIAANRAVDRAKDHAIVSPLRPQNTMDARTFPGRRDQAIKTSPGSHLQRQRSTLQNRVPRLTNTLRPPESILSSQNDLVDLECSIEFGGQSENYGAEPSSYRRLKRSRSLLTPVHATRKQQSASSETSFNQRPNLRASASSATLRPPGLRLRLKRSLKFLKTSSEPAKKLAVSPTHRQSESPTKSEAVQLAKSQSFQEANQIQVSKKRSLLPSSKADRTLRVRQNPSSMGCSDVDDNLQGMAAEESVSIAKEKQRSISLTLSNRIKKFFGKTKHENELPPQQLNATRPHFDANALSQGHGASFDNEFEPEVELERRRSFYIPSRQCSDMDGTSGQPSIRLQLQKPGESCASLSSASKSRVTSWTNSTATGSIIAPPSFYDSQRLSIIQEDGGPHDPSSSIGRHIGGISVFQQPLDMPEGQQIDSQRIYSALIRRIDQEQREMENTKAELGKINNIPHENSNTKYGVVSRPTVRRVESRASTSLVGIDEDCSDELTADASLLEPERRTTSEQLPESIDAGGETPREQRLLGVTCANPSRNMSALSDPFRTASYEESYEQDRYSSIFAADSTDSDNITTKVHSSYGNTGLRKFVQSSDSLYSRTTNGGTNPDYISPVASSEDIGMNCRRVNPVAEIAAILQAANYDSTLIKYPLNQLEGDVQREDKSNVRWNGRTGHRTQNTQNGAKTRFTHFRENAQIDPEQTSLENYVNTQFEVWRNADRTNTRRLSTDRSSPLPPNSRQRLANIRVQKSWSPASLRLREVPENRTSDSHRTSDDTIRSQTALISHPNLKLTENAKRVAQLSDNSKPTGLRKLSAGSFANRLKTRDSQILIQHKKSILNKENNPTHLYTTPPKRIPSRNQIHVQNDGSPTRLESGKVDVERQRNLVGPNKHLDYPWLGAISPSYRLRAKTSAQHADAIDLESTQHKRPSEITSPRLNGVDSSPGQASTVSRNSRNRRPKPYGNLGLSSLPPERDSSRESSAERRTTAPSKIPRDSAHRSISGLRLRIGSRRVLSNLLRGKKEDRNEDDDGPPLSSPALGGPAFL